ncbi:MAG: oxidoreductase [Rhodobacteraceae bacterium PARR1]|nr:MAG: oxidoreductase [Rhodobacteraceae bacterium PARR1]
MSFMRAMAVFVQALAIGWGCSAVAEPLPKPTDTVILSVAGSIAATTGSGVAEFDLAGFESLGTKTILTTTIWTEGEVSFRGVPLKTLLDRLGAKGSILRVWALNDYTVDVPFGDAVENGPILAIEADGKPLSVRDKGPIWLLYPFDDDAQYQTEVIYARSIWQIERMEVLE